MDSRKPSIRQALFAGAYLDRRAEERNRADWLSFALTDPETRFVVVQGTAALVTGAGVNELRLALLGSDDPAIRAASNEENATLLGWFNECRCVLLIVDASFCPPPQLRFEELRMLAMAFAAEEAGLFGYARALAHWRATHRHCGRCGAVLRAARAGHALICSGCAHESFPRLDPAIIVLVNGGEFALLGRQSFWPPNRFSTIAGFVEPGEALEDAVRREVHEETGVVLDSVHYFNSQPWPFPASLMLGFLATAQPQQQPMMRDGELEDARWFTREDVRCGRVLLPPVESISRQLINHWLGTDSQS
ncbi:MAG: NAD(+) diphosphatase [Steroidobacteraceae bacterium]